MLGRCCRQAPSWYSRRVRQLKTVGEDGLGWNQAVRKKAVVEKAVVEKAVVEKAVVETAAVETAMVVMEEEEEAVVVEAHTA
uniref:Uncharacterized protein n=1 Tax=Knipowitschia caucasica TaxID=637954 RepID=A0AAV2K702_KNICA